MHNERKQTNRNEKQSGNLRVADSTSTNGNGQSKNPLGWDARDIKTDGWVRNRD